MCMYIGLMRLEGPGRRAPQEKPTASWKNMSHVRLRILNINKNIEALPRDTHESNYSDHCTSDQDQSSWSNSVVGKDDDSTTWGIEFAIYFPTQAFPFSMR